MTNSRAQEILREALAIASGQKSGTTTAETEHVRAIGRYSADLLHALIWLEDAASARLPKADGVTDDTAAILAMINDADRGHHRSLAGAIDFARKIIHAAGGLTVAEETQLNLETHRHHDPVEERLDDEADHA